LKPAGKQRAQRQAFERCAQLAEHVLNTRALGEIALFVRVFAETKQYFAAIKVAADARRLRVFPRGRTSMGSDLVSSPSKPLRGTMIVGRPRRPEAIRAIQHRGTD
jgi:hypothetical protein